MKVIGTAGHVDHGKSTLVSALTGINPDRLKEEQAREMTIELGFAWLTLPDGEEVGVVDVPGHRDFIENMLAGVGGIDAALFVVAADEGVMPQTREHLAILNILQVQGGVVALTKTDLVEDPEWLDLVEADLRQVFKNTILANAPIVRVSAKTGQGVEQLKTALAECLAERPPRLDFGRPRLPIDRVFSITGFGTVVTGTLSDGQLKAGDEVEILPGGFGGRVRGLQTHKRKEETAVPGSRTAVNVSGVDVDQVRRGDVLVHPGKYLPSARLDAHFRLLPDAGSSILHNMEANFFLGAAEVKARIRLLGTEELLPGQEGWLQLELEKPVVAVRGDRYILRRPSPGETLGGGSVVDSHPEERHKRFSAAVISRLEQLLIGSPADLVWQASLTAGIVPVRQLILNARLSDVHAMEGILELFKDGRLMALENGDPVSDDDTLVVTRAQFNQITEKAAEIVRNYHQSYPLRLGIHKEELKSKLKLSNREFNALFHLWRQNRLFEELNSLVKLPGHAIIFNEKQQIQVASLMQKFKDAPFSPPSAKECQETVGEEIYYALIQNGTLIQVSKEVIFRSGEFNEMVAMVRDHFKTHSSLTVVELRDRLNTSRKYILAFLEYLDEIGITERKGDFRVLKPN